MRRPSTYRLGVVAVLGSNLIAPIGVLAFGWSTTALLGVVVLELVAVLFWSVVKLPFAAKRPNNAVENLRLLAPLQAKRGSTAVPGPLPPVYLRNLPMLIVAVVLFAPLELTVALGVFALSDPVVTDPVARQLLLGGLGVFVGRGIETATDYFRAGGYRDHSPRSVLLASFKHFFGIGALLLIAGVFGDALGSAGVLWVIIGGKLVYDLRALQVQQNEDARGVFYRLYGSTETEIEPVPIDVPEGAPTYRVRTPRRVRLVDALYQGVLYSLTSGVLLFYAIAVSLLVFAPSTLVVAPFAVIGAFVGLQATARYVRYGWVEYHCYDDVLIVHDTVLDTPQARLERDAVTGLSVEKDLVDRCFGTQTLAFETVGDESREIQFTLPDPEAVDNEDRHTNVPLSVVHVTAPGTVADALGERWRLEKR
ncbi:hypothetical protein SAMN04487950_0356 [Halogranum rubrum]|uniref:PH domain-containing protein n=1 Tax=Halogranum rubrum TaxID=553466 RepID=A0A1I4B6F3_9EURY|nr:DUF6498-containing protein [Halogranum rubrum]SFK64502.1 hypothetical protein SAMN04487950_0356 [Halogranum rubrum]